jgi:alpha 1,6-mannosyltransferase
MISSAQRRILTIVAFLFLVIFALFSTPRGEDSFLPQWKTGPSSADLSRLPPSAPLNYGLIPKYIWQIYFYDHTDDWVLENVATWHKLNPECSYTRLTKPGSEEFVKEHFARHPELIELYMNLRVPMLRGDLLRYMILATRGGVYADIDVSAVQALRKWVPKNLRNKAKAVVGIEFDKGDGQMISGFTHELQFASWTLASAPGHPLLKLAVDRIKDRLYALAERQNCTLGELEPSDEDILTTTGPASWTTIVMEGLSRAAGREITFADISGLQEPTLFGDILVLSIDGFAGNVPHSGAGTHPEYMLIRHGFAGTWRGSGQKEQTDEEDG